MFKILALIEGLLTALKRDDTASRELSDSIQGVRKAVEKVAEDVARHEEEINTLKTAPANNPNRFKFD